MTSSFNEEWIQGLPRVSACYCRVLMQVSCSVKFSICRGVAVTKIPLLLQVDSHHSHSSSCRFNESPKRDSGCHIMLLCQVQHVFRSCLKPRFLSFFERILITLILQVVAARRVPTRIQVVILCYSVKFSICRGVVWNQDSSPSSSGFSSLSFLKLSLPWESK